MLHYLWITLFCFLCVSFTSAYSVEEQPIPTTRQDLVRWFKRGIEEQATHLIVVLDRFSYEDFPDYVYSGQLPQERVQYWNSQDFCAVMEVYALHLDLKTQVNEYRSWHLDVD